MNAVVTADPALTVALALAAGMLAQAAARHLQIPGIVVLLGTGVLLGPDVAGLVRPDSLGPGLHALVGFAVAVILFEGGMNLEAKRLRRAARSIRQLVTLGAAVTAMGGSLAARWILGWTWTSSILFGTLVIVTGPTVITPLLRRIRVQRRVATILEAEGVLVDAVGALVAVVALEVAISPSGEAVAFAPWHFFSRVGFGVASGLAGGLLTAALLRIERLVPEGLENVFTLGLALALFQVSNAVITESGIVSVVVAGLVVGNVRTRALPDLREFKEQLTVMLIGMLFVLLAADVRLDEVRALGWPGAWTVLALMFVVRPLNIFVGTLGSDLKLREKLFLSWLAPRGIVAAAVASLFAQSLAAAGIPGGSELRAMVFLVIAATVLVQGLSGGLLARALGLRRPISGYVILGANDLAREMGRAIASQKDEVVLLDSNPDACRAGQSEGFRVLHGSGLSEGVLGRAALDGRAGCFGLTSNDELNLLFARTAREEYRVSRVWVALRRGHTSVTPEMVRQAGARVLFGEPRSIDLWTLRLERNTAQPEVWRYAGSEDLAARQLTGSDPETAAALLPVAVLRGRKVQPVDDETAVKRDDRLHVILFKEKAEHGRSRLRELGFVPDGEQTPGDGA